MEKGGGIDSVHQRGVSYAAKRKTRVSDFYPYDRRAWLEGDAV